MGTMLTHEHQYDFGAALDGLDAHILGIESGTYIIQRNSNDANNYPWLSILDRSGTISDIKR